MNSLIEVNFDVTCTFHRSIYIIKFYFRQSKRKFSKNIISSQNPYRQHLCILFKQMILIASKKKGKKKFSQKRSILEERIHWKRNSKNSLNIPPRHRVLPPRFYDFMKFQEIEVFTILVINYCSALNDLIIQSPLSSTPHDISINHPLRVKLIPSLLRGTNATANLPPRWRRVITQKRISFFRCRGISGGGGRMGGRARP